MSAAIYVRMSVDKTGEEAGVQRQLEECQELATRRGLEISHVLSDNDISATTGKRRPGFEQLLELAAERIVDTVVVWHTDRLYRKLPDLSRVTDAKLNIVSVRSGDLDLSTPAGKLVATVLGGVATNEGEQRTERQQLAYKQQRERGHWKFSHRPFGYQRAKDGCVDIVESEAAVIRELYSRYFDQGESRYALVRDLNERGIRTATGKEWTITQLREVLGNPRYAGHMTFKKEIIGTGSWTPIIDPETYERYTKASASRKALVTTFSREATSLLSGLIRCGVCGGKVYRTQRSDGTGYSYACQNKRCVNASVTLLDKRVTDEVVSALLLVPSSVVPKDSRGADIHTLAAALQSVQERRAELTEGVAAGLFKLAQVTPLLVDLNSEEEELGKRKDELARKHVLADVLTGTASGLFASATVSLDNAAEIKTQIRERFEQMPLARKRELIRLLVILTLHRGRGAERLEVEHTVALGLNEEAAS